MLEGYPAAAMLRIDEHIGLHHNAFITKVERRYRSYKGLLRTTDQAARWTSKLHPPYIFQIVETIVANLVEDRLSFKVTPRPRMDDIADIESLIRRARSIDIALKYFHDVDELQEKQRPHFLQQSIAGLSVGKCSWAYEEGPRRYLKTENEPVLHPLTGEQISTYKKLVEHYEENAVTKDQPTFEVIDVRDWVWHGASKSLDQAPFVAHRMWYTFEELKRLEKMGVYTDVDGLKESRNFSDERGQRELEQSNADRTKDMIEVWEYWDKSNQRVCSIGNREHLLREREDWPFDHGQYPFVVCSSMPDLFVIPGTSDVELVEELQQLMWELGNQRLDNIKLLNNMVMLIRDDAMDISGWEYSPGAQWLVQDVSQVKPLEINPAVGQISLEAEALLKGDLQNITGGMPFMSGASSEMDQKTATGVSIVTSLAQKRLAVKRASVMHSMKRKVQLDVSMIQQFVREPRLVQIVGKLGAPEFMQIPPEDLQGEFVVQLDPMNDSLMQQEIRANAQAKLQVLSQVAVFAQASGVPLNFQVIIEDFLRDFGVQEPARYFAIPQGQGDMMTPPAGPMQPGGQPQPGGEMPGQENMGTTSATATDASSPSATGGVSQSGVAALARLGAQQGGAVNV